MAAIAHDLPANCPRQCVLFDGRKYPLLMEHGAWRLRSRSKKHPADFYTGTALLPEAKRRAKEYLTRHAADPIRSRKGGGFLEGLAQTYLATPKRTKANVAADNVSRLRSICRLALGRELDAITCREVGPELWEKYQRAALAKAGHAFDLVTRHRENVAINAAVRCARCLFLPQLLRAYTAAGFDVRLDAGAAIMLPVPTLHKQPVDESELLEAWAALQDSDSRLWLTIGLARFAGLRREEISAARVGWIERDGAGVYIRLRDRPEEGFWIKTGESGVSYRSQVIDPGLADWLVAVADFEAPDARLVSDPGDEARHRWFERVPQEWIRAHGVADTKPLHRLRGLYADHTAKITEDAVAAQLAGRRAAQQALGHTTLATTEAHYLTSHAVRR